MNFTINHQTMPEPRKKINGLTIVMSIVVLLCIVGLSGYFIVFKHSPAPFPVDITAGLNYQTYELSDNTNGYSLQSGSAKIQTGLLFFTLKNGPKKSIFVTEQALPDKSIDFSSLPKHSRLDVPIGRALIGTGLGNPSVVIVTSTTLIQLTSSKGVTQSDISGVAQKMTRLAQTGNQY